MKERKLPGPLAALVIWLTTGDATGLPYDPQTLEILHPGTREPLIKKKGKKIRLKKRIGHK